MEYYCRDLPICIGVFRRSAQSCVSSAFFCLFSTVLVSYSGFVRLGHFYLGVFFCFSLVHASLSVVSYLAQFQYYLFHELLKVWLVFWFLERLFTGQSFDHLISFCRCLVYFTQVA